MSWAAVQGGLRAGTKSAIDLLSLTKKPASYPDSDDEYDAYKAIVQGGPSLSNPALYFRASPSPPRSQSTPVLPTRAPLNAESGTNDEQGAAGNSGHQSPIVLSDEEWCLMLSEEEWGLMSRTEQRKRLLAMGWQPAGNLQHFPPAHPTREAPPPPHPTREAPPPPPRISSPIPEQPFHAGELRHPSETGRLSPMEEVDESALTDHDEPSHATPPTLTRSRSFRQPRLPKRYVSFTQLEVTEEEDGTEK